MRERKEMGDKIDFFFQKLKILRTNYIMAYDERWMRSN